LNCAQDGKKSLVTQEKRQITGTLPAAGRQMTNEFQWSKFQTEEKRFGHLKLKFGIYL
jgi:hypothetical protein